MKYCSNLSVAILIPLNIPTKEILARRRKLPWLKKINNFECRSWECSCVAELAVNTVTTTKQLLYLGATQSEQQKPVQNLNNSTSFLILNSQRNRTTLTELKQFSIQQQNKAQFRRRTFHVLNSRYKVRLMKSSASELGLTSM